MPQFLYPFICQWASRLLPCPGYCKYCCDEHWGMCVFFNYGFLRVYAGGGNSNPLQYSCLENPMVEKPGRLYSPWSREESDTTEQLHFHFSLSCIGEGNGNPLQCSCLRIPGMGEPGGLPSMGLHRVSHDWSDLAAVAAGYMPSNGVVGPYDSFLPRF